MSTSTTNRIGLPRTSILDPTSPSAHEMCEPAPIHQTNVQVDPRADPTGSESCERPSGAEGLATLP
jgi:hypothetical protein